MSKRKTIRIRFEDSGAPDEESFSEMTLLGFDHWIEFTDAMKKGYQDYQDWIDGESRGFKSKSERDYAKKIGFDSQKEIDLYHTIEEDMNTLLQELLPGDEISTNRLYEAVLEELFHKNIIAESQITFVNDLYQKVFVEYFQNSQKFVLSKLKQTIRYKDQIEETDLIRKKNQSQSKDDQLFITPFLTQLTPSPNKPIATSASGCNSFAVLAIINGKVAMVGLSVP
ncbi:MAG: hypothetical protein HeimC3_16770 [Candidatus Heimdallarchaeota archaeon LC_3]|nr:MAG: hypothetical protein HeimC3_16770 [Candidatus Heimdallarchaeota archaeon LC_3]